jgi:hypothetical protein
VTRILQPCGTNAAYQRHLVRGEEPCEPCRKANRAYQRAWRNGEPTPPPEPKPCGTRAAYVRHRRNGEEPCQACRDANNEAVKASPNVRAWQRARQRAMVRLSHIDHELFEALFAEEKAKEGLR